jgi:archaellum biogenesis ATPase FlaH
MVGDSIKYLLDFKHGRISQGLGIDTELDNFLVYKKGQLNIIVGHDNVGKSYFVNWYFLVLALKYNIKFCIYSGENSKGQILRDMIQMYSGQKFKDIQDEQIISQCTYLEQFFEFVPNNKLYKPKELLTIFEESGANACLIDPYTALDRQMSYEGNYQFLNQAREFCNKNQVTIYINTHPISESGRAGNLYPKGHDWEGLLKPPLKDSIEGGKSFTNRSDDVFIIHRLLKSESMKYYTMINVEKVKDTATGGNVTPLNEPILAEFNSGLGFKIGGKDALHGMRAKKTNFVKTNLPF